jgi:hypothetical protein
MLETPKPHTMLTDFITGKEIPNIGAEENRQRVERFLIEKKGYDKEDVEVDADLRFHIGEEMIRSDVDLVVRIQGKPFMIFKCVAGFLGSRHRETLASARLLDAYQIPLSVVTDGKDADVLDTITAKVQGHGLDAIPSKDEGDTYMKEATLQPLAPERLERERIIFRSYDEMNVNVQRKFRAR